MSNISTLNEHQREAVLHTEGPLLIVAGAGAGKTLTLTHRITHLISRGVSPEQILAVTFTNKAANEMKNRVQAILQSRKFHEAPFSMKERPFIGTFHALGVFILRHHGNLIGIKKNFSIKDKEASLSLIKEVMRNRSLDPKQYSPRKFQGIISRQKGSLVSPETYSEQFSTHPFFSLIVEVWEEYEQLLKKENSLDFDDLIQKPVTLLKTSAEILAQYQKRWRYIHIDEYQDTNHAQYMLSRLLSIGHKNICVVGDYDQVIYSWRGANIENILRFEKDYPRAKTVLLEENYRSTKIILNAANEVIKKNKLRKEKKLFTQKSEGEKLSLTLAYDEEEESRHVALKTREIIKNGVHAEDIAVLYRANFQSRAIEEAFLAQNIPYHIIGTRFFERKEVKDVLAYINAALNTESLSDIKRIMNVPPRGIGKVATVKLFSGQKNTLPESMQKKVDGFFVLLKQIKTACEEKKPSETVTFVIKKTGIEEALKNDGLEGEERLENIRELVTLASRYDTFQSGEGLMQFLNDAVLASDQDALQNQKNGVRLMTVHAAKGLEFQHVFIVGLEQGLFPHDRVGAQTDINDELGDTDKKEEERRLFYVALTRGKEKIYLSFAQRRTLFGSQYESVPSEFLHDIPSDCVLIENTSPGERVIEYL